MGKRLLLFLVVLIVLAVYISRKIYNSDSMTVQGSFITIKKVDNTFSQLFLKLKNDSVIVFKTIMRVDDPNIAVFKKGFDIAVTYKENRNPDTGFFERIIQSIVPAYTLKQY